MCQTSLYAVLTLVYPDDISFVVGCLETAAGLGLSFGPVLGTIMYEAGGISMPFLSFFLFASILGLCVKYVIPEHVDHREEETISKGQISYTGLLKNKRILFANL